MDPYRRVSVALFLHRYIFSRNFFVGVFQKWLWKRNLSIFWWNQLKHHKTFPHFHHSYSMSWQDCIISREQSFSFLISKHNDLVQSKQQNWSYSISQLVHFWFDKSNAPSEVMYFSESCWIIFQCLYTLFLLSISLFYLLMGGIFNADTEMFCYQPVTSYHLMLSYFLWSIFQ